MRHKNRRWLFAAATLCAIVATLQGEFVKNSSRHSTEERSLFAPRMDYEQWTPIGRGDPLKMDPTFDYVPPVLDRVHYWAEPQSRKPDLPLGAEGSSQPAPDFSPHAGKTEILLLGVSSKKSSIPKADARRDSFDASRIKYIANSPPKYQQNHYQRDRIYYPYAQSFPAPTSGYYKLKNERLNQKPYQLVPYTILMPPPHPQKTSPSPPATIQQSNLIYHSSSNEDLIPDVEVTLQAIRSDQHQKDTYHTSDSMVDAVTWRNPLVFAENGNSPIYKIGKVENVHMDNTYVNIRKPEVHLQSEVSLAKPNRTQSGASNQPDPSSTTSFAPKSTTASTTHLPVSATTQTHTATTDPLFKHYKQPAEPLRGPMYLIIQGHSKVKTYGPGKQVYGINVQEFNEIPNADNRFKEFPVKHMHGFKVKDVYTTQRSAGARQLRNLAEIAKTAYGAPEGVEEDQDTNEESVRRNDEHFQVTGKEAIAERTR